MNALLTPMSLDPYQQLRYAWGIGPDGRIVAQTTVRTLVLSPTRNPRGDLDGDCMIGPSDVVLLLRAWGSDDTAADLDADGVVGVSDLLDLVMRWDF